MSDSVQVVAINRVLVPLAPSSGHISRVTSPSAELTPFGTAPAPYRPLDIGIELFNFDIDVNLYIYTVVVELLLYLGRLSTKPKTFTKRSSKLPINQDLFRQVTSVPISAREMYLISMYLGGRRDVSIIDVKI